MPLIPTGFNITVEEYNDENLTVIFLWDEPQGSGPQIIVDNYIITISPSPLSPSYSNILPNVPLALNVTLSYNVLYTMATITASNCAGESETLEYPNTFRYGTKLASIAKVFEFAKTSCSQLWRSHVSYQWKCRYP